MGIENPDDSTAAGILTIGIRDIYSSLMLTLEAIDERFLNIRVDPQFVRLRGATDMSNKEFRLHDADPKPLLGKGVSTGSPTSSYRVSQRVSWVHQMLPYLGDRRYENLHASIKGHQAWTSETNMKAAYVLVPHFLHPNSSPYYSNIQLEKQSHQVALTHFVGMTGVGGDSAYFPKSDPRAGIFGDPLARPPTVLADIKDGASNTIFMIANDPGLYGPWMQGGGGTMRGTSVGGDDVGYPLGFRSPNVDSKEGALTLMADGSVRYLHKGISPSVFKALATMAGGENEAPVLEDQSVLAKYAPPLKPGTAIPGLAVKTDELLGDPVTFDSYEVRPPKNFKRTDSTIEGNKVVLFSGPVRNGGSAPNLMVRYFKSSDKAERTRFDQVEKLYEPLHQKYNEVEAQLKAKPNDGQLRQSRDSLRKELDGLGLPAFNLGFDRLKKAVHPGLEIVRAPTLVKLGSTTFLRAQILLLAPGQALQQGTFYIGADQEYFIMIYAVDNDPYQEQTLPLLEASANTFRRR
jgi:hypothetical protein